MALSIEELLACEDRPIESVHIDDWKGEVTLRVMTGTERDSLAAMSEKKPSVTEMRRALFTRGLCDADGNRLKPDVIEKVLAKSGNALEQLSKAISDINGLNPEARVKLLGKPETNLNGETESSG